MTEAVVVTGIEEIVVTVRAALTTAIMINKGSERWQDVAICPARVS